MHPLGPTLSQFLLHGAARELQPDLVEKSTKFVRSVTQIITGAVSAMARKRSSLSRSASSTRLRSVMSWPMPMLVPFGSWSTLQDTSITRPSRVVFLKSAHFPLEFKTNLRPALDTQDQDRFPS